MPVRVDKKYDRPTYLSIITTNWDSCDVNVTTRQSLSRLWGKRVNKQVFQILLRLPYFVCRWLTYLLCTQWQYNKVGNRRIVGKRNGAILNMTSPDCSKKRARSNLPFIPREWTSKKYVPALTSSKLRLNKLMLRWAYCGVFVFIAT